MIVEIFSICRCFLFFLRIVTVFLVDESSEQYCLVDDNSEEGLDTLVDISDILFDISPLLVSQL